MRYTSDYCDEENQHIDGGRLHSRTRRGWLQAAVGFACGGLWVPTAWAALRQPTATTPPQRVRPRIISLLNTNTGESLNNVEYWSGGRYQRDALAALSRLMRDHHNGQVHPIDPRLFDVLADVLRGVDRRGPVHLLSGYRSPETNQWLVEHAPGIGVSPNSFHIEGQAIDLRIPKVPARVLYAAAVQRSVGGVGFYPRSGFVHLDVGPPRTWAYGGALPGSVATPRPRPAAKKTSSPRKSGG